MECRQKMGLRGSKRKIILRFGVETLLHANMAQLFVEVDTMIALQKTFV